MNKIIFLILFLGLQSCGLKVIHPDRPDEKGTLMLDYKTGTLVGTYTCTMVAMNGKRVYATDKTEEEARKEVVMRCQDQTLISFCKDSKISCEKN